MTYTGAKRMPLTLPTIFETCVFHPPKRNIPQLQAAVSLQLLSQKKDFGEDP